MGDIGTPTWKLRDTWDRSERGEELSSRDQVCSCVTVWLFERRRGSEPVYVAYVKGSISVARVAASALVYGISPLLLVVVEVMVYGVLCLLLLTNMRHGTSSREDRFWLWQTLDDETRAWNLRQKTDRCTPWYLVTVFAMFALIYSIKIPDCCVGTVVDTYIFAEEIATLLGISLEIKSQRPVQIKKTCYYFFRISLLLPHLLLLFILAR